MDRAGLEGGVVDADPEVSVVGDGVGDCSLLLPLSFDPLVIVFADGTLPVVAAPPEELLLLALPRR